MKFSRLVGKAEKIVDRHARGQVVESEELSKLQHLLVDKISRYEEKIAQTQDEQKRDKLQTRLKVVKAQLQKSRQLLVR